MDPREIPNLLYPAYDEDLVIPPRFDEYDSGREDQRAETRRVDWVWREARDTIASCMGHGAPTADLLEALTWELPPGHIRWRIMTNTERYRRAERKVTKGPHASF